MDTKQKNDTDSPQSSGNLFSIPIRRTLKIKDYIGTVTSRWWFAIFELLILAVWAMIVGLPYLNLDPYVIPTGREFGSAVQSHHIWTTFKECGWCALWNGSVQGGSPAFVDVYGSSLHPIVMLTTLNWGVINGSKISLVIAFWIAGLSQWWIARELRVGWLPRTWSAALAITAGHLAGRMEMGVFGVIFSTALCSLVFGGVLAVSRHGGRKMIVLLGVVIASALLSGQGYLQIGLLSTLPAWLILLFDKDTEGLPIWKGYLIAVVIGILLAGPFLIPLAHFLPNLGKFMDPEFTSAQPLAYLPLNLVINNADFYRSDLLDKFPYPYLYTLYLGWVPVILAIIGFGARKQTDRRLIWFLFTGTAISFFVASALPLKWLVGILPSLAGIRQPSLIAGLSLPLILGLSSYGLDHVLKLEWPTLWMNISEKSTQPPWRISLRWLLVFPLFFSLLSAYRLTHNWIYTDYLDEHISQLLDGLETENLQWINPPYGEHKFIIAAIERGMKLSPGIRPWQWKDRELPIAALEAFREIPPEGTVLVNIVDQVGIYSRPEYYYAAVVLDDQQQPCTATGSGGRLTVFCDTPDPGKLVVQEYTWSGWGAWMDGERVSLVGRQWLEVEAPAGKHTYQFRYRPWDVPVGLFLLLLGILACVYQLNVGSKEKIEPSS